MLYREALNYPPPRQDVDVTKVFSFNVIPNSFRDLVIQKLEGNTESFEIQDDGYQSEFNNKLDCFGSKEPRNEIESLCKAGLSDAAATLPLPQGAREMRFTLHTSLKKKAAFTLAEVLITLGIIGVVAALTLPSLIQQYREKEYTTKLKKFYTVMENAARLVEEKYGTTDTWGLTNSFTEDDSSTQEEIDAKDASKQLFWKRYAEFINIRLQEGTNIKKVYGMDKKTQLSNNGGLKRTWNFNDGTIIRSTWLQTNANTSCSENNKCGDLSVDLNGDKGPNSIGHDIFFFEITRTGIRPLGYKGDTSRPFDTSCVHGKSGAYNGYGCTAWVIYNENMDYLHCDGLGWDKKLKCK